MRKFKSILLSVLALVVFFFSPCAEAETIRNTGQSNRQGSSTADPLAPFLGNPGRSMASASAPSNGDPLQAVLPVWSGRQEASSESKLGWALWEMTQKTGEAARNVKDTVKTSLTDYVKDKQKQSRQQDLIDKFYANLQYVTNTLHLAPRDQQELTARIQRVYIEDAESGRYEFDSLRFRELPYLVRREYADMVLERTENGEAETYHLNGEIKTQWHLKNGQPEGPIVTYYENGEINFIDVFKDGKKVRRTKYDEEGKLVFEQNYEYRLPEEENLGSREFSTEKKEVPAVKTEGILSEPSVAAVSADKAAQLPEDSQDRNTSGLIELPPQIHTNLIEA